MPKTRIILIYENQTGFTAVWQAGDGDATAFGLWLLDEMKAIADHCFPRDITPNICVMPLSVPREDLDTLAVEELLCHT